GIGGGGYRGYHYDPLFAYYRQTHGANWAVQVNNVYVERYRNPDLRPPRTLVQQTTVVNNITNNTVINNTNVNNTNVNNSNVRNVKNVTMVAPITKVDQTAVTNLTRTTPAQQAQAAQQAQDIRLASIKRAQIEAQTLGKAPLKPTDAPRTVKLDLPKPPPVT